MRSRFEVVQGGWIGLEEGEYVNERTGDMQCGWLTLAWTHTGLWCPFSVGLGWSEDATGTACEL